MKATRPSEVFRARLRQLRKRRRISQRELVRRVRELGVPMHQPGVSRIEAGTQSVSLDEAVAISAVFDLLPEHLYRTPLDWEDYVIAQGALGPDEELTPDEAWLRAWKHDRLHDPEQEADPTKEDQS